MNNPCDVKIMYDTEFEAEIASSKVSYRLGAEMITYRCGTHWHLANKDRSLRSRNRPNSQRYCLYCDTYMKKGRWATHITRPRHRKMKEGRI